MARELINGFKALAQASDALIDSFRYAHVSVLTPADRVTPARNRPVRV
jgi:hypothetical protein